MSRNISELHPRLQTAIKKLQAKFPKIGIGECFRSVKEQDDLYAQGRTKSGKIVTNAKGSSYSSQHQWGIAVDFFYNEKGNLYPNSFMNEVGNYAKSIGLGWGGDWRSPVDKPHLYLPDWGNTTAKLKQQYGTFEKFKNTWKNEPNLIQGTFYKGIDFSAVFDKVFYLKHHTDVANDSYYKNNPFEHFVNHGMKEGRQGNSTFNVKNYRNRYQDLQKAFGNDLPKYYQHYIEFGKKENRTAI